MRLNFSPDYKKRLYSICHCDITKFLESENIRLLKPDYNTTQDLQGVDDKLISPRRQSTQSFHSPITQLFQTKLHDIHIDAPNFTLATYSTLEEKM